ncbi:MAG TPA: hypothetical protein VF647_11045 [Longimicrobium sp.]|jgi:hypothetical protein
MQWIDRALLHRAGKSVADRSCRVPSGSARHKEEVYRTRLTEALRSVRGMEIEDVYPAGADRAEVHH